MMRDQIIAAARSLIGTPFRHQGRIAQGVVDCAGAIVAIADDIGADYLDQQGYSSHPSNGLLESALDAQPCLVRVPLSDMQPADVLLMKFASDPQHLAIYVGFNPVYQDHGIVHAYAQARKVCEHRLTDEWRARIVRVYRFQGAA